MPDPVLAWCDDIHSVRGNVSQLQATLNQLVLKTPSVAQYKDLLSTYGSAEADKTTEAPHILEKLRSIMNSPQVKVAVRLRNLYEKGYLPFLLGLSHINFKSQKCDRYVGYLLDFTPPKVNTASMFPKEGNLLQKDKEKDKEQEKDKEKDDIESSYPPTLPPIENQSLLNLIFTDKSLRQPSDFLESEHAGGFHDYNNNHNSKLMLRGKDILNLALLDILDENFPKAHEDDLEFLKYRLTATEMLAKLAFSYNFSDTIMHQIPQDAPVSEKLKVFRNVFLAYIGGMSKSDYSFSAIRLWVSRLYEPLLSRLQLDQYKTQLKSVHSLAHAEINFMLRRVNNLTEDPTRRIKYEYRTLSVEVPVACQLLVSDEELGVGTGTTLEEARQKASWATMETLELRSKMMSIIVKQFRKPAKEKPAKADTKVGVAVAKSENGSEDESYSPDLSADDYDPEESHKTSVSSDTPKAQSIPTPQINYGDAPALSTPIVRPNGTGNYGHVKQNVINPQQQTPYYRSPGFPVKENVQPPAPPQARMPLPYGKLPPIPNMKKKGGKS